MYDFIQVYLNGDIRNRPDKTIALQLSKGIYTKKYFGGILGCTSIICILILLYKIIFNNISEFLGGRELNP
jgi:hypothetical protein